MIRSPRILTACMAAALVCSCQGAASFDSLGEGQVVSGFRTEAAYLNDAGERMGARFVHQSSGFIVDLLAIESVPQTLTCVTTFPTSDMGEPHTQEHLLLGKGSVGRAVATGEPMALADSTAFTMQWRTCYAFNTAAGPEAFFDQYEQRLDALLHPDYTDEEIRREVRHFSVARGPDGTLALEEGGTVYNEMVASTDQPGNRIYRAALHAIYGAAHPLALNSGGSPEALRRLAPADIREFHSAHYHLGNIGSVIAVPADMSPASVLEEMDAMFARLEPASPGLPVRTPADLPAPEPAPAGGIRLVPYSQSNTSQPGSVWLVWPATRDLDLLERTLLGLFVQAWGNDTSTTLYKRFIDSETREIDLGAQSVFADFLDEQGYPFFVGFGDVPVAKMNEADLSDLRRRVREELDRVVALPAGSTELVELTERLEARVIEARRSLSNFVNSPPEFGTRGVGGDWVRHLDLIQLVDGFERPMTLAPVLDEAERILREGGENGGNVWAEYLPAWDLTSVEPWVLAMVPDPDLAESDRVARARRLEDELARLQDLYGLGDAQAALGRYARDYEQATARLDQVAGEISPPRFVDTPPMSLDDQLDFRVDTLRGDVPFVVSTFGSMTSATAGIALSTRAIPQERLVYLSLMPELLTRAGVIEDGEPVSYDTMTERMRREILGLESAFSTGLRSGRVELVVRGAGNDLEEAGRAIRWMELALLYPDWRPANLPRLRDVVDQTLAALRRTTQSAEENWVRSVADAWWKQDNPRLLASTSFMTRTHNAHRLRWMLRDASPGDRAEAISALEALGDLGGTRAERLARLAAMASEDNPLLVDAAADLGLILAEIPDRSLARDWTHLTREMASDLGVGPAEALARLDRTRRDLLSSALARTFLVASGETGRALAPRLGELAGYLDPDGAPPALADDAPARPIAFRLMEGRPESTTPVFVGLVNPNSQSGVFLHSAPLTSYADTDRESQLDYLSALLYGGGGAHSMFMKTWGAGLAYSNGIGAGAGTGRVSYYAERTPELPQTLRFVIGELRSAEPDPDLVEYAVAQAFLGTRAAAAFEDRGEAMARDLADGITPDLVARFRQGILDLRDSADLTGELYSRMAGVYARVLPGMGAPVSGIADGVYFVIGPESQIAAWEAYLRTVEGPETEVFRLYPRDFWMH